MRLAVAILVFGGLLGGIALYAPRCSEPGDEAASGAGAQDAQEAAEAFARKFDRRRLERIDGLLEKMQILSGEAKRRRELAQILERFQARRAVFWDDPATNALGEAAYAKAYRELVDASVREVRGMLDGPAAEAVIRRFVFDGRIMRRPEGGGVKVERKGG